MARLSRHHLVQQQAMGPPEVQLRQRQQRPLLEEQWEDRLELDQRERPLQARQQRAARLVEAQGLQLSLKHRRERQALPARRPNLPREEQLQEEQRRLLKIQENGRHRPRYLSRRHSARGTYILKKPAQEELRRLRRTREYGRRCLRYSPHLHRARET